MDEITISTERAAALWRAMQEVCDQYWDLRLRAFPMSTGALMFPVRGAIMFQFARRMAERGELVGGVAVFLGELADPTRPVSFFRDQLLSAARLVHTERAMPVPEGWALNVERIGDIRS